MTNGEKSVCDVVLDNGIVIEEKCFEHKGVHVENYMVEYRGERYSMTKHNGEWVYFHHYF